MAALRSASFCLICFLVCSCTAQEKIPVKLGEDVTLPCKVPINNNIRAVEWIRPDQDPDYVFLYRDGHLGPEYQHPSYQNRVNLQDKEMKDGDVSLNLTNVTMNDTGRYECYVAQGGTNRRKRSISELISITNLEVRLPGDMDGGDKDGISRGHPGVVGVTLPLLAVLASLGFLMYKRSMRQNPNLPVTPVKSTAEQML